MFIRRGSSPEDAFMHTTSVQYKKMKNRNKILIEEVETEPLVIPMVLYFKNGVSEQYLRAVRKWFDQTSPQELIFHDKPDRVYYAMRNGDYRISHNGGLEGTVEFNMLTNSSFVFRKKNVVSGDSTSTISTIEVWNDSDRVTPTTIAVTMPPSGVTDVEIINTTTGDMLTLKNNLTNEIVTFYSEYEEIHTSSDLRYGYDDHNDVFINLAPGINNIQFQGAFHYSIEFQPVLL